MARFRNYRQRFSNFRSGFGRRFKSFRSSRSGQILGMSMPYAAGVVIGLSNLDDKIPADYTLVAAIMPTMVTRKVKGLGQVKAVAQGIILGNLIQKWTGYTLGGASSSTTGTSSSGSGW